MVKKQERNIREKERRCAAAGHTDSIMLLCYMHLSFTSNNQQLVVHERIKQQNDPTAVNLDRLQHLFPNKYWILISCSTCHQILWTSKNQTASTHIFNSNSDSRTFCERPEGGIGSCGTATKWTVWWDCFLNCCFQGQELQLLSQHGQEVLKVLRRRMYSSMTTEQTQPDDERGVRWFTFPGQVLMDRLLRQLNIHFTMSTGWHTSTFG